MKQRTLGMSLVCGALLFGWGGASVFAQEQEVVIQRVEVHSQDSADGEKRVFGMIVGPDGGVQTFGYGDGPMIFAPMAGGPGNFVFSGRQGGPGRFGGLDIIDPGRTYIIPLSKRNDVRSEILMSARQREALEALEKNGNADLQKRMKEQFQNLSSSGKAPDEFRKEMEERAKQSQALMQQFRSDQDRKFADILSPKQLRRLKELDLQWRGPLAMSVAEIAENVGLTEEQRTQISDLLQEYRKEVSKQMMSVFGGRVRVRQPGPNKDQPGSSKDKQNESGTEATPQPAPAPAPPSTPEEWRLRAEKASKQIEKTRKTLGEKALALLSPEQKQAWIEMQGRTFRFRLVD